MVKDWSNRSTIIVASGPSLNDSDVGLVRKAIEAKSVHVIAVNDNWRLLKAADAMYAADHNWWTTYYPYVADFFCGEMWTCDTRIANHYAGIKLIDCVVGSGLPESPDRIKVGRTSTAQALQLAYLWGAKRIALLGVDCQPTSGKKHWFGDHIAVLDEKLPYSAWIEEFTILAKELAAEGIEVINCSPETALTCFHRTTLAEFLK